MKQAIMIYTNQQPQSLEIEASLKAKLELAGFRLVEPGQIPDYLITIGGDGTDDRSEERRVGKECRSRWSPYH